MNLIVAGSRHLNINPGLIGELIRQFGLNPGLIVHGGAEGVDTSAALYAAQKYLSVSVFQPDYQLYHENTRYAPIARNEQMAHFADALLLVWDGKSRGSKNMKEQMQKLNKPVYEVILK